MNNDMKTVIKSQYQPDEGEGHSAGQAIRGNAAGEEGLCANMRGDAQKPSEAIWNRDESATQDEVLYSSYEEGRRLGARAWKVNEHTPRDPISVTQVTNHAAKNELDKSLHDRMNFDCGVSGLNGYLARQARKEQDSDWCVCFVATESADSKKVMGYDTLSLLGH